MIFFSFFLYFAASAAAATVTAAAATVTAAAATITAAAALQYLQGARIRTRASATADRCATNELLYTGVCTWARCPRGRCCPSPSPASPSAAGPACPAPPCQPPLSTSDPNTWNLGPDPVPNQEKNISNNF